LLLEVLPYISQWLKYPTSTGCTTHLLNSSWNCLYTPLICLIKLNCLQRELIISLNIWPIMCINMWTGDCLKRIKPHLSWWCVSRFFWLHKRLHPMTFLFSLNLVQPWILELKELNHWLSYQINNGLISLHYLDTLSDQEKKV